MLSNEVSNLYILETKHIQNEVAAKIVTVINRTLHDQKNCIFVPSAGKTLVNTFARLSDHYSSSVDWSRVICIQMDEYYGITPSDRKSFAWQIRNELINPLGIGSFMTFFNEDGNLNFSPQEYEARIHQLGGIDLATHGVGRNAHIGFSEPCDEKQDVTRIVELSSSTRQVNGVEFTQGITIGMKALCNAHVSIIVLAGTKKYAGESLLFHPKSTKNLAAYLRDSTNVSIYMDYAAVPAKRKLEY